MRRRGRTGGCGSPIWMMACRSCVQIVPTRAGGRDLGPADPAGQGASTGRGMCAAFDQIRADLAGELLLCGEASGDPDAPHTGGIGIRAQVTVVVPALSLLGARDEGRSRRRWPGGADRSGNGAEAGGRCAGVVRILTHPVTGMVLAGDTYRPSEKLRNFLHARDRRCRFPG